MWRDFQHVSLAFLQYFYHQKYFLFLTDTGTHDSLSSSHNCENNTYQCKLAKKILFSLRITISILILHSVICYAAIFFVITFFFSLYYFLYSPILSVSTWVNPSLLLCGPPTVPLVRVVVVKPKLFFLTWSYQKEYCLEKYIKLLCGILCVPNECVDHSNLCVLLKFFLKMSPVDSDQKSLLFFLLSLCTPFTLPSVQTDFVNIYF